MFFLGYLMVFSKAHIIQSSFKTFNFYLNNIYVAHATLINILVF